MGNYLEDSDIRVLVELTSNQKYSLNIIEWVQMLILNSMCVFSKHRMQDFLSCTLILMKQ